MGTSQSYSVKLVPTKNRRQSQAYTWKRFGKPKNKQMTQKGEELIRWPIVYKVLPVTSVKSSPVGLCTSSTKLYVWYGSSWTRTKIHSRKIFCKSTNHNHHTFPEESCKRTWSQKLIILLQVSIPFFYLSYWFGVPHSLRLFWGAFCHGASDFT